MKKIRFISIGFFVALCIVLLHILAVSFLPVPFDALNISFLALVLMIVFRQSGNVVWMAFVVFSFLNLFSSLSFGMILFPGVLSVLSMYWFYRDVFTNDSFFAISALSASGLVFFRLVYCILLLFQKKQLFLIPLFSYIIYEIIFTTFCVLVVYVFARNYVKKYTPRISV